MSILSDFKGCYKCLFRLPMELCQELIFATNTKPHNLEVYFKIYQNVDGRKRISLLFRFYGKNTKASGRPAVYDCLVPMRAALKLINLAEAISHGSIFDLYFANWLSRKREEENSNASSCLVSESDMQKSAAVREQCRVDFYEKLLNGRQDGMFLSEQISSTKPFGDQYPVRDKKLTLDYVPVHLYRNGKEVMMKPWVFRVVKYQVRNRDCNIAAGEKPVVIPAQTVEIRLSAVKLCELAIAIYNAVMFRCNHTKSEENEVSAP